METLTIKELAPYLPYGLRFIEYPTKNICELVGLVDNRIYLYNKEFCGERSNPMQTGYGNIKNGSFKPILRSLSDLTKEIEHNGERFVPIVEISHLLTDSNTVNYSGDFLNYKLQIDDEWNHCVTFNGIDNDLCFSYDSDEKSFYLCIDFEEQMVSNQYEMFKKLFEWHFDVFGLISKNLAIDINQIK